MKNKKIKIIRTASGCLSAVGLLKELKKRNVFVVGVDCDPLSAGFYFSDKSYVVPKGGDPDFLSKFLKVCDIEKPDAIISGPEEEIIVLAKNKDLFKKRNILLLCPDYESVKICFDKISTHIFFKKENIPVPEMYDKKNDKFPAVIKPRFGRGGRGVFIVNNAKELEFYATKEKDFMLQEFIDGTEYTVDIFSDTNGNALSVVPRIRLKTESGISVKSKTIYDKEIIELSKKISEKLKLIGPSCIQCIKNKDGIKFIEINPRFGGGSILSLKADASIIPNFIKIVSGKNPTESKGFKKNLTMLRYFSEYYF